MNKIIGGFAAGAFGVCGVIGAASAAKVVIPGYVFEACSSQYISMAGVKEFFYDEAGDSAWRLVAQDGWGGDSCSITFIVGCEKALSDEVGDVIYGDWEVKPNLLRIQCSCVSDADCVGGFKCQNKSSTGYGFCTSTGCSKDSDCSTDKGYLCISGQCQQKCYVDAKPAVPDEEEETAWTVVAQHPMYNIPMIESYTSYSCTKSGSSYAWNGTTTYRCSEKFYGTPTSASGGCELCDSFPGPATSEAGSTKPEDCYLPDGTNYGGREGQFVIKGGDCYW